MPEALQLPRSGEDGLDTVFSSWHRLISSLERKGMVTANAIFGAFCFAASTATDPSRYFQFTLCQKGARMGR